jgi:aminoglycoside phosphotransferase (APT) family kinase protein
MIQSDLPPLDILRALGITETCSVFPVQGGFDMMMWKVESERQTYALRVFRVGAYEQRDHEDVVMATAQMAGLPVPEIHAAGVWQDHPVLLLRWLEGRMVSDELRARPWRIWTLGVAFGRMQAAIHAVSPPELLRRQPDAWMAWNGAGEQILQDRFHHLSSGEVALLHLDYHPRNVLTDGKRITGVLDWTNAHAGDPRADAARTVSILRVDPLARNPLLQRLLLRIFELAWRRGYQRQRGRLKDMPLFYAWAGTVLQSDLAHRYKQRPQALDPARRWTDQWKARARRSGIEM